MRTYGIAFVLLAAATAGAGCSSSCKAGTLLLHIGLVDDSPLADTITVVGHDPGAAVSDSFPHTPNQEVVDVYSVEHIIVSVTWPQGYPSDANVRLMVSALANGRIIGVGEADVDLGPKCSVSELLVSARGGLPDGGAGD